MLIVLDIKSARNVQLKRARFSDIIYRHFKIARNRISTSITNAILPASRREARQCPFLCSRLRVRCRFYVISSRLVAYKPDSRLRAARRPLVGSRHIVLRCDEVLRSFADAFEGVRCTCGEINKKKEKEEKHVKRAGGTKREGEEDVGG